MKLEAKKSVFLFLFIILLSFIAAGCGFFIAGDSETEDALAGEHGELPEWLFPSSRTMQDINEDLDEANDSGELEEQVDPFETEGSGLAPEESLESPAANGSQSSADSPQQQQKVEQESSGAEPGTMAWIEEQQKQREAAKRQKERERILANLEEESSGDEDQDAWWDIHKKDEPGMSHQFLE